MNFSTLNIKNTGFRGSFKFDKDAKGVIPSYNNNPSKESISFTGALGAKTAAKGAGAFFGSIRDSVSKYLYKTSTLQVENEGFAAKINTSIGGGFLTSTLNDIEKLIGKDNLDNRLIINGNTAIIKERTQLGKLIDGVSLHNVFLDVINGSLRYLKKIPVLKNSKHLQGVMDFPLLKKRANTKKAKDYIARLNTLLLDVAKDNAADETQKSIIRHANKITGNYDTRDERALNRLATGFVSAWFVGKDFHNLSMYEDNDKNKAKALEKKRANRERGRIVLSAFTTYSILGAFSKYINKNATLAVLAITASSLFAEVTSRLFTHTPLLPLTPEQAKRIAQKRENKLKNGKNTQIKSDAPQDNQVSTAGLKPSFTSQALDKMLVKNGRINNVYNAESVFDRFKINPALKQDDVSQKESPDNIKTSRKEKNPVTFKRFLAAAGLVCASGIAYSLARTKCYRFDNAVQKFYDRLNAIYNKITQKRLIVSREDIAEINSFIDKAGLTSSLGERVLDATSAQITHSQHYTKKFLNYEEKLIRETLNGEKVFYDLGTTKRKVIAPIADILTYPVKTIRKIFEMPLKPIKRFAGIVESKEEPILLKSIYDMYSPYLAKFKKGKITSEEFAEIVKDCSTKKLNETSSKLPNTSLAEMSRTFVTLVSSYFFINDFRNETLIQSKGEDKERAAEVTRERLAHKISNFFLNQMFMNFFNTTFSKQYMSSLVGATGVACATEFTNETLVRKSIGVPTKRMSREEIQKYEDEHFKRDDFAGKYYRFMAKITGKKTLSQKAQDKTKDEKKKAKSA